MDDVVTFEGFDRPRKIRVDVNSVSDFEDKAGLSIFELVFNTDRLRIGTIRMLLWATMKADDKRLTPERVGEMLEKYLVEKGDLQTVADALVSAINKSQLITALSGGSPNVKGADGASPQASANGSENAS